MTSVLALQNGCDISPGAMYVCIALLLCGLHYTSPGELRHSESLGSTGNYEIPV